jgi:hypothetical protein
MNESKHEKIAPLTAKLLQTVVVHCDDGVERGAAIGGYVDTNVATSALLHVIAAINTQTDYGRSQKGQRELADEVRSNLRKIMKGQIAAGFKPFATVFEAPKSTN